MPAATDGVGIEVGLQILIEMCDALDYIHQRGVIHRDVKPDNIFLETVLPTGSNTKLLDFGVMHVLSTGKSQASERMFIGTFRYAAPEQLFGHDPTPQTDLYALGLVGFEILTGSHPFASCETIETLAKAQIEREPPPFPGDTVYPEGLEALIQQTLRKKATERPASAEWLASQFRQIRLQLDIKEGKFAAAAIGDTSPSPVQNALTESRAEATDPGDPPSEASEPERVLVPSTAPDSPQTQWMNQAATVERPVVAPVRTTADLPPALPPYPAPPPSPLARMRTQQMPVRPVRHASIERSEEDNRYVDLEPPDPAPRAPANSGLPPRPTSSTSSGSAMAVPARPAIVERLIRVRWLVAATAGTAITLVAAYVHFHSPPSPVSEPIAVPIASSASPSPPAPHAQAPLPPPERPAAVLPSSEPTAPEDLAPSLPPSRPHPPPPIPPVVRPPAPRPAARPPQAPARRATVPAKDDIERKMDPFHTPVARPSPAPTRPVNVPEKDDVKRTM